MSIKQNALRFWSVFLSEQKHLEHAILNHHHEEEKEIVKILSTYFEELCNCTLEVSYHEPYFELVLLSELDKNAQLICLLLKSMAPKEILDAWVIHSCIPPMSQKALQTSLRVKEVDYTSKDFIVDYEVNEQAKYVNVSLWCDAFQEMEEPRALELAIYMLQLFIGDVYMEAYINDVQVSADGDYEKSVDLTSFYKRLHSIVDVQSWITYEEPSAIYRAFHIEEEHILNTLRKDMRLIATTHPVLLSEVLNQNYVTYHQFFDFGGEFGYLYYERTRDFEESVNYRKALESKIQTLLFEKGIAKSIGGGVGEYYAYIDFAIFDKLAFHKALDEINRKLSIQLKYRSFEDDEVVLS